MCAPAVLAGILDAARIAAYRNHPVYLRELRYVPPTPYSCTSTPILHGNGCIARFPMNAMFCSWAYPWTVVRHSRRAEYLAVLETASTRHDILSDILFFTTFLQEEMRAS